MKEEKDELGNRMKEYEMAEAGRMLMPLLPIMARLDGKCFSKFTKGLARPYDQRMSDLMVETTKALVDETNAKIGYTQSDEISLVLYTDNRKSQIYFNGRIQKMIGDMAAFASLTFNKLLPKYIPEKADLMPRFDCRVWNVPTQMEAINALIWRENDATKNSVSMATRAYYSHRDMDKLKKEEMMDLLMAKNINWNDYPSFFKRGTYVQRKSTTRKFSADELEKLPAKHIARTNPDLEVVRTEVKVIEMPPLTKIINQIGVVFNGEEPLSDWVEKLSYWVHK